MIPTAVPLNQIPVTLPGGVPPNVNPVVKPVQSDQSSDFPNISVTQDNNTPPTPTDKQPDTLTTPRRYPLKDIRSYLICNFSDILLYMCLCPGYASVRLQ